MNSKQAEITDISSLHQSTLEPPLAENAWFRYTIYRFFGSIFLYPNQERLKTLREVALELLQYFKVCEELIPSHLFIELLEELGELIPDIATRLEEKYVSLFLVNPKAPLYEYCYRDPDGFNRGWISIQIECEYAETGLALTEGFKQPPDHIAAELEFMAYLSSREALAREVANEGEATQLHRRQQAFLRQHLGQWFPSFAQRIKSATSEGLYFLASLSADAFIRHQLEESGTEYC